MLPIPAKLLRGGVTDMVRISDARMSGTGFGHRRAARRARGGVGGPLALVRDGDDRRSTSTRARSISRCPRRSSSGDGADCGLARAAYRRGYGALYLAHVLQADEGCDFDFLRALPDEPAESEPLGSSKASSGAGDRRPAHGAAQQIVQLGEARTARQGRELRLGRLGHACDVVLAHAELGQRRGRPHVARQGDDRRRRVGRIQRARDALRCARRRRQQNAAV